MAKILADLALKLEVDAAELKQGLADANRKLDTFKRSNESIGRQVQGAWLKLGAAVAAAGGAIKIAEKIIQSTQGTADAFARVMATTTSYVNSFFIALSTGDFKDFISNANKAAQSARDLADALDFSGDIGRSLSVQKAKLDNKQMALYTKMMDRTDTYTVKQKQEFYKEYSKNAEDFNLQVSKDAKSLKDAYLKNFADISGLTEYQVEDILTSYGDYTERFNKAKKNYDAAVKKSNIFKLEPFKKEKYLEGLSVIDRFNTQLVMSYEKLADTPLDQLAKILVNFEVAEGQPGKTEKELVTLKNLIFKQAAKEAKEGKIEIPLPEVSLKDLDTSSINSKSVGGLGSLMGTQDLIPPNALQGLESLLKESADIRSGYRNKELRAEEQKQEAINDIKQAGANFAYSLTDLMYQNNMSAMNKELAQEGLTEEQSIAIKKKYAQKQKRMDTAQAIINGALAVSDVWKKWAANPVVAVALSALAAGAVGLQVAAIQAQSFAKGGIVGGGSYTGDRVPIMANSGEMILNGSQQRKLFNSINNGGSGGQVTFRIEGSTLVGVLNKMNKINSYR